MNRTAAMTNTFKLTYDYNDLATVTIDSKKAEAPIKDMVEFWSGWEGNLRDSDDDYTICFLRNLAMFVLREGRKPSGVVDGEGEDEGWVPLDGTYGITVNKVLPHEFDRDLVEIEIT